MSITSRFALPLLAAGQAQKEVTHNEALLAIDRWLHPSVVTRTLSTPPASPVVGTMYIVGPAATGAWAGHSGELAAFDGGGWIFMLPRDGCLAWIADEAAVTIFDGGWISGGWPVTALQIAGRQVLGAPLASIAVPVGGAVVDAESRATLAALIVTLQVQGIVQ